MNEANVPSKIKVHRKPGDQEKATAVVRHDSAITFAIGKMMTGNKPRKGHWQMLASEFFQRLTAAKSQLGSKGRVST